MLHLFACFWVLLPCHFCYVVHMVLDAKDNFQTTESFIIIIYWLLKAVWLYSLWYRCIYARNKSPPTPLPGMMALENVFE